MSDHASMDLSDNQPQRKFWCHQCRAEITPKLPEFSCPTCANDFIEEIEAENDPTSFHLINEGPTQQPQPQPFIPPQRPEQLLPPSPFDLFNQFAAMMGGQPLQVNISTGFAPHPVPFMFPMQSFVVNTGGAPTAAPLDLMFQQLFGMRGGHMNGDYVPDVGFDNILNQLFEMAGRDHRRKPASKEAIDAQKIVKVGQENVDNKEECAICKDEFQLDEDVMQLGCKHRFHPDCIKRWLGMSTSCPVCRCEIKEPPKEENGGGGDRMEEDTGDSNSSDSPNQFYI